MKKVFVLLAFLLSFLVAVYFIIVSKDSLKTDMLSILNTKNQIAINAINQALSREFVLISDDEGVIKKAKNLAVKSGLFKDFDIGDELDLSSLKNELNSLKIISLNRDFASKLKTLDLEFYKQNASGIFSPTRGVLSLGEDFLNLSSHSSLLNFNARLNLNKMLYEISTNDGTYFMARGELRPDFSDDILLDFVDDLVSIKTKHTYFSSPSIYSALGKHGGEREGLVMGVVSLFLVCMSLVFAFARFRILLLGLIPIYGFTLGLFVCILLFKQVHIISIIISTSLVGLMLDFSLHWLSHQGKNRLKTSDIRPLKRVFLLGLLLSAGGYFIFIFSPLLLLKQIAILCTFGLLAAFCFSYFAMPLIYENASFSKSKILLSLIYKFDNSLQKISKFISLKRMIFSLSILCFSLLFLGINAKENIKEYDATPRFFTQSSIKIAEILSNNLPQNMILLSHSNTKDIIKKERGLIDELLKIKAIDKFNAISSYLLSENEQDSVKNGILKASLNSEILNFYTDFGISKDDVSSSLLKETITHTLSLEEAMKNQITKPLLKFLPDKNTSVIYTNLKQSNETSMILAKYNAQYVDLKAFLDDYFSHAKIVSIELKLISYVLIFGLLILFFDLKRAVFMIIFSLFSLVFSVFVFAIFGLNINIFAIFGFVLASAIGVDYMVFALNLAMRIQDRMFGILMAFLTSFFSFFILVFSATPAVSAFGLSVSLCIFFNAIFACILCRLKI